MLGIIVILLVLSALVALCVWLALRAWSAKRALVRWPGVVLATLLALVLALLAVVCGIGLYKLYTPRSVAISEVTVPATPDQIARGQHIAEVMCAGCHSTDHQLPLSGGDNLSEDAGLPLGDIYAPNLTPGGDLKEWSDTQIFRVIRTGVDDEGRPTAMALVGSRRLSDEDVVALIAYLRSSPPVQKETPEMNPSPLLALLVGSGLMNLDPAPAASITAPPKAVTVEYGKYVSNFGDCESCHGPKLDGNPPPPAPKAPDITVVVPKWSKEDFIKAMRTGVTPDGDKMDAKEMPWNDIGRMDDTELEALYVYLHGLTAVQY